MSLHDLSVEEKYNRLTVIKQTGIKNKAKVYLFKCDCGKEKEIRGSSVKSGYTKSCGCLNREVIRKKYEISQYTQFGYLTVIGLEKSIDKPGLWYKCMCKCGNTKIVLSSNLTSGRVTSCGCITKNNHDAKKRMCSSCLTVQDIENFSFRSTSENKRKGVCKICQSKKAKVWRDSNKEKYREYQLKYKYKDRGKSKFQEIKRSSKRRDLEFDILYEDFLILINRPCFYCGQENDTKGLDRVNNKVGYKIENVVSCCRRCNEMKMDEDLDQFLNRIQSVYKNIVE